MRKKQEQIHLNLKPNTGNFQPKKNHRKRISRVGRVPVKYRVVRVAIVSLCNARGLSVRAPHDGCEALAPPLAPSLTLPGGRVLPGESWCKPGPSCQWTMGGTGRCDPSREKPGTGAWLVRGGRIFPLGLTSRPAHCSTGDKNWGTMGGWGPGHMIPGILTIPGQ